jgi:uncharacterized protein YndB with AHSA1/START domain
MPVTNVQKDPATLTMTITSEFDASVEQVWRLWSDPRRLERWWGPPGYPTTVVKHELAPGGMVRYFMTGPEGDSPHGWWNIRRVDAPYGLEFDNGIADASGEPDPSVPAMIIRVTIEALAAGTRMSIACVFPTTDAMDSYVGHGMAEGMSAALSQIDAFVAS